MQHVPRTPVSAVSGADQPSLLHREAAVTFSSCCNQVALPLKHACSFPAATRDLSLDQVVEPPIQVLDLLNVLSGLPVIHCYLQIASFDHLFTMEMTREALLRVCKENKLYQTPSLNDKLYCNFKGFTSVGCLEEYVNLKSLFLEGNAIESLRGLPPLPQLKCL